MADYRKTMRKQFFNLARRLKLLSPLFEEIRDIKEAILDDSYQSLLSLMEALESAKELFRLGSEASKIYLSWTSTADILAPIFEDVCKEVNCGKGICKPSDNITVPFKCECSPGWKQVVTSNDDQYLKFLPCVIPNCTLNYSCSKAPSPVQQKENRGNESIFDVCSWTDCGGGKCKATSLFTHNCECSEGYHNLLNLTFSPCFQECSLGMDCKNLGFGIMNRSSPPPPSLAADRSNHANFRHHGRIEWLIFTLALLAI